MGRHELSATVEVLHHSLGGLNLFGLGFRRMSCREAVGGIDRMFVNLTEPLRAYVNPRVVVDDRPVLPKSFDVDGRGDNLLFGIRGLTQHHSCVIDNQ
jgi:hypothetical protein